MHGVVVVVICEATPLVSQEAGAEGRKCLASVHPFPFIFSLRPPAHEGVTHLRVALPSSRKAPLEMHLQTHPDMHPPGDSKSSQAEPSEVVSPFL